jgi:hypothetical protein
MRSTTDTLTLRRASLTAGLGFLVILILFLFNNFLVLGGLIESADGVKTASNIANNPLLLRGGIAAFMVLTMVDLVVAWGLYVLLHPVNKTLSLISTMFRVVSAAVLAAATINLVNMEYLVASGKGAAEIGDQVGLFANGFTQGWQIALGFYGIHLLLVGYLAIRSGFMPKLLGALIVIAALGYTFDSFATVLIAGDFPLVSNVTFIGEVLLIVWLLAKGSRLPAIDK